MSYSMIYALKKTGSYAKGNQLPTSTCPFFFFQALMQLSDLSKGRVLFEVKKARVFGEGGGVVEGSMQVIYGWFQELFL